MERSLFLEKDSPVDFLYLDKHRISSLIGQLSDKGMLVGLKSVVGKSEGKEGTAGGSIAVAKAEGKASRTHSESQEATYDPFWTHAYSFLRDLEENFAVPLDQARMGSLVKFEALIQFLDLRIMRNLWEPSAHAFLHSVNQAPNESNSPLSRKKRREQRQQQAPASDAVKIGLEVLKQVPHLLHLTFLTRSGIRLWAAAQPDHLTISSEDLVMKYGAVIDGVWTVVGRVDGRPGDFPEPLKVSPLVDGVITAMAGLRELIGRPKDHFGLTPIAIYAPIEGVAEAEAQSAGAATAPESTEPSTQD
jgi:hypothetical protein